MPDNVYQSYIIDHNHQVGQNDIDDMKDIYNLLCHVVMVPPQGLHIQWT